MGTPLHVTGLAKVNTQNAINSGFDSVANMIDNWVPKRTPQNFRIFNYYGVLEKGMEIAVNDGPYEDTPLYTILGAYAQYVGMLHKEGFFKSDYDSQGAKVYIYQPFLYAPPGVFLLTRGKTAEDHSY